MKRKLNIPRIIWVTALFLLLIIILLMIMDYKINYQYLPNNKLYFYECENGNLCTSEVLDDSKLMYSKYDCGHLDCPLYKSEIEDDYALLKDSDKLILYQYRTGDIISEDYEEYIFLSSSYFIVKKNDLYGVINNSNDLIVNLEYQKLGLIVNGYLTGYNSSQLLALKDDNYGIISYKTGSIIEEFKYTSNDIDTLLDIIKQENNNP